MARTMEAIPSAAIINNDNIKATIPNTDIISTNEKKYIKFLT